MQTIEAQILLFISNLYNFMQWPGVVILMAIESACIPVPSELIMPLAGWMLIKEKGLAVTFIIVAGAYGALGNLIGSIITYAIGMWGGRPLLEKYGRYVLITRHDLARADQWFQEKGSFSVFISRILPVVRTFISLPAGITRMNFVKFSVYTFIGSFIWSTALAYGGYQLGEHWDRLRALMRPFDPFIIGLILLLIGFYIYRHIRRANRKPDPETR